MPRVSVGTIGLALPFVAAVIAAKLPLRDNSYLWHVRAGTLQSELGAALTVDPFSFTAQGQAWRTQSWLADLLYGWLDQRWGLEAVMPLVLTGSLLLMGCVGLRLYRWLGDALPTAIAVVWVMWLVIGYFTPRPVLISLALLALFLVMADDRRLRWALPLVVWLWASVHGGFIVGLGYLVLDGLRRRDRSRLIDLAAATGVSFLSAHGWGTWEVVLAFLGSGDVLDLIVEWRTPDLISFQLAPFAIAIAALIIGAIRQKVHSTDLWVVLPFLLFAFTANRAVPIAALVLAPWFAAILVPASRPSVPDRAVPRGSPVQNYLNLALIGAVLILPWVVPIEGGVVEERFARQAIRHLSSQATFHDDAVGGYLIYAEWPERRVFIDDRAELYGELYSDFVNARGGRPVWRSLFHDYKLEQALLKLDDPLYQILTAEGWRETYRDEVFVVLVDRSAN